MKRTSTMLLRAFAGMLLLTSTACNKKLPTMLPCGCEPDQPGGKKGHPSSELAVCGTLNLPIDSTQLPGAIINVFEGMFVLGQYNLAELGPNETVPFGGIPTMQVSSVGYHFSVTGIVTDLKHNPLVQLQDSKWYVYKNNIGRYNYDANGLEVYDKLGHIVLSIDALTAKYNYQSSLMIQGIVPTTDSSLYYLKLGDFVLSGYPIPYGTPALNSAFYHIYDSLPIPPVFRYTGPGWQHARL